MARSGEKPILTSQCHRYWCVLCCSPAIEETSLGEPEAQIILLITALESSFWRAILTM